MATIKDRPRRTSTAATQQIQTLIDGLNRGLAEPMKLNKVIVEKLEKVCSLTNSIAAATGLEQRHLIEARAGLMRVLPPYPKRTFSCIV